MLMCYNNNNTMTDFIPTRGASTKKNVEKSYEVVTFETHKKSSNSTSGLKKNKSVSHKSDDEDNSEIEEDNMTVDEKRKQELEMKRYRYDVIKFGMSGGEKHKVRQAKVALAISLGAKPPKNRRKNYKKVIEERKRQKAQEAKKEKFASGFSSNQLSKNSTKNNKSKTYHRKNKESNGILGNYGKVTKNTDKKTVRKKHKERR